ncbi:MAG: transposase [Deltaproteobacteria bacterium]|nr:transposase [Deltaproteobacteria bacterium]
MRIRTINVSEGPLPEFIEVTEGKAADIRSAGHLLERIPAGSVITMDRGYIDYKTLYQINESNKFSAARTRDEMKFTAAKDPSDSSEENENEKEEAELKAEEGAAEESFYDETKKTTFEVIRDEKVNPANKESFKA